MSKDPKKDAPDDIVGHRTFDTGEIEPTTGVPVLRHEPSRCADTGHTMLARAAAQENVERIPDEQGAIFAIWRGYQRLKELGWNDACYCPKDGSQFFVIEPGSISIHKAHFDGAFWVAKSGNLWPSQPILFKRSSEAQAKEDARREETREKLERGDLKR